MNYNKPLVFNKHKSSAKHYYVQFVLCESVYFIGKYTKPVVAPRLEFFLNYILIVNEM